MAEPNPSNCTCLNRVGDNGDCPVHPTQVWGRAVPRFDNPLENWAREKAAAQAVYMKEVKTNVRMPVLEEREKRYGDFSIRSKITQDLKCIMQQTPRWNALNCSQREALEMIQHKIGRILNGDPNYADSWVDIAGYATLVAERLQAKEQK